MKQHKTLILVAGFLLVANVFLIITLNKSQQVFKETNELTQPNIDPSEKFNRILKNRLDFSDEQLQQFSVVQKEGRDFRREKLKELKKLNDLFLDELEENDSQNDSLLTEIISIENSLTKHKYKQFQTLLEIAPKGKKENLKRILKRVTGRQNRSNPSASN